MAENFFLYRHDRHTCIVHSIGTFYKYFVLVITYSRSTINSCSCQLPLLKCLGLCGPIAMKIFPPFLVRLIVFPFFSLPERFHCVSLTLRLIRETIRHSSDNLSHADRCETTTVCNVEWPVFILLSQSKAHKPISIISIWLSSMQLS